MSEIFASAYAGSYDDLYRDKNYESECDLIEKIFRSYSKQPVRTVLDLGCGTGNHAHPLSRRGYQITGVDRSESMIALARGKKDASAPPEFFVGDVRSSNLKKTFDAVLMMFAVLGYQHSNADVLSALKTARLHAKTGGLFLFDVWYGPAVLLERPSERTKVVPLDQGELRRVAKGELDTLNHTCRVTYKLQRRQEGRAASDIEESHVMRYFFPREIDLFLELSGFAPLRLAAFPEFDRAPDETTWNVLMAAQAI